MRWRPLLAPRRSGAAHATTAQMKQWFDAIDRDRDGQITASDLQAALQIAGLEFSLARAAHLVRAHDATGSGTLGFGEFLKLHDFITNVQSTFEAFDTDRSRTLSRRELSNALAHAGFRLDAPALEAAFSRFDPTRRGGLGLAEFIALTLYLRRRDGLDSIATFAAFDTAAAGRIDLDFNQFLFAAAHCV